MFKNKRLLRSLLILSVGILLVSCSRDDAIGEVHETIVDTGIEDDKRFVLGGREDLFPA